ncbi:MAG: PadR family transcriptional regulator [Candidatus Aminicenantes bacterium]|nr:PadR family transcriptional regulator [Candidatus Aminicenantes bacterium]
MKYLTTKEELILITVLKLGKNASLVNIRKQLIQATGHSWSVGNVYVPLDRMAKLGFLASRIGDPTARRGGKAVKYYSLKAEGRKALSDMKKIHDAVWADVRDAALE